jgi:hypothetical protein
VKPLKQYQPSQDPMTRSMLRKYTARIIPTALLTCGAIAATGTCNHAQSLSRPSKPLIRHTKPAQIDPRRTGPVILAAGGPTGQVSSLAKGDAR